METITLYRPVNQKELDLIAKNNWEAFPPRLPEQPIFYPILNMEYARKITLQWNVPAYGRSYITKFVVPQEYLSQFKVENVGGQNIDELWIPAEKLDEFNQQIIGKVEVVETHE